MWLQHKQCLSAALQSASVSGSSANNGIRALGSLLATDCMLMTLRSARRLLKRLGSRRRPRLGSMLSTRPPPSQCSPTWQFRPRPLARRAGSARHPRRCPLCRAAAAAACRCPLRNLRRSTPRALASPPAGACVATPLSICCRRSLPPRRRCHHPHPPAAAAGATARRWPAAPPATGWCRLCDCC